MISLIKKIRFVLDKKQKKQFAILGVLILIGGFLETLGISALMSVITVVISPDRLMAIIEGSHFLLGIYNFIGIKDFVQLVVILLSAIIIVFIIKNLFSLYLVYYQSTFINHSKTKMTSRVLREYLNRPYEVYLTTDIPTTFRLTESDIPKSFSMILALLQLASEVVVVILLFIILLISNWQFTLFLALLFGGLTLFVLYVIRPVTNNVGRINMQNESIIYRWRMQSIYGLKDIKVLNREGFFVNNYFEAGMIGANTFRKYNVLNSTPRLLGETIFIIGVIIFIMYFMISGAKGEELALTLGVFGIAAIRILPSFTRINTYFQEVSFYEPAFESLCDTLEEGMKTDAHLATRQEKSLSDALVLNNEIALNNITYAYPGTTKKIFLDASMRVRKGESVGIIGTSGAGKSTIVDILLGLLQTQSGTITCDGRDIFDNYESWLRQIGYIPQSIYLVDDSIRNNIAFGINEKLINDERIWEALREAQLDEFVRELPEGIETHIGDRGVRISGGQRQRVGIARALYHNPEILVFDEATSALDNETEQAVMDAINNFHGRKTMIIIAHRLNTIAKCDVIYKVLNGKLEETQI